MNTIFAQYILRAICLNYKTPLTKQRQQESKCGRMLTIDGSHEGYMVVHCILVILL